MPERSKKATERNELVSDKPFVATVQRMLASKPKLHDEMKKGAAPKRNAHVSKKGSKG